MQSVPKYDKKKKKKQDILDTDNNWKYVRYIIWGHTITSFVDQKENLKSSRDVITVE